MKRALLYIALFSLLAAVQASHAATNRAVSLRVLESVVKSGGSRDAQNLCGITRMSGYITDKKTHDIILFGQVDPAYPALHLDDFVVALRSVNMAYARKSGHTYYITPPGCSIDPNPKVLRRLREIGNDMTNATSREEQKQQLENWKAVAASLQNVRVMGVPFDTRFAKVMVDADYYMKRLVNGSVNLSIPGFDSLMGMNMSLCRQAIKTGKSDPPASSMSRFWFYPGQTAFEEEDGVVTLVNCQVKLLTEEEFLTESGTISGAGRPNPMAKVFAESFTAHYNQIAAAKPIYKELQGLFRFVALAKLMRGGNESAVTGANLGYLRNGYRVNGIAVSRALQGLTRYAELNDEQATDNGKRTMRQTFLSCGGVSMDVRPVRVRRVKYVSSRPRGKSSVSGGGRVKAVAVHTATTVKHAALTARKSANALYWDFPKTP